MTGSRQAERGARVRGLLARAGGDCISTSCTPKTLSPHQLAALLQRRATRYAACSLPAPKVLTVRPLRLLAAGGLMSAERKKGKSMKYAVFLLIGAVASGCEQPERDSKAMGGESNQASPNTPADNTDKNERDRKTAALTPGDQGGSEADRTVTQQVRQGVMDADALSTTGKNVKIITVDGVVTLRGPVKTEQEKSTISSIAQRVDGVKRVDNQLETVTN